MTRRLRDEGENAVHHVVAQGNGRGRIVLDDSDRISFEKRFARLRRELGWFAHASCLMDTHHHAVVGTAEPNLGLGMGRLQGGHARWFNQRHQREGHLFKHRFWSRRIEDDGHLFRACLYVVLNPVAAGLCRHPSQWRWCSYRITAEGDAGSYSPGEERLLSLFGDTPGEARRRYAQLVTEMAETIVAARISDSRSLWQHLQRTDARQVPG